MEITKATKKDLESYIILKIKDVQDYSKEIKKKLKIPSKSFIEKEFNELTSNKNAIILFAKKENETIGYLVGNFIKNPWNNFGYIGDIFTESKFRKKGIGKKLIKEFEKVCRKRKRKNIRLDVSVKNKKALSLYKKEKFITTKYHMEKNI